MLFRKKTKDKETENLKPLEVIYKLLNIKKELLAGIDEDKLGESNQDKNKVLVGQIEELIEKAMQTKASYEKINREALNKKSRKKNETEEISVKEREKENRKTDGIIILLVLAIRELESIKNILKDEIEPSNISYATVLKTLNFLSASDYIVLASELSTGIEDDLIYNEKITSEELEEYINANEITERQ